jgi:hypothetical protein
MGLLNFMFILNKREDKSKNEILKRRKMSIHEADSSYWMLPVVFVLDLELF